ncbi:MAG: hypothetical protein MUF73_06560 [Rhodobacteraceae bacterium]|jgi:hypothetical protein|nr:hypothetical protein [Paracoccaceae bacterium]
MATKKITHDQWLTMLADPAVPDKVKRRYTIYARGPRPMQIQILPNPDRVDIPPGIAELESAIGFGNAAYRLSRNTRFNLSLMNPLDTRPVLVAEGDSWFQFPLAVDEVIDHLTTHFRIDCGSAAGDTLANMAAGPLGEGAQEYMLLLRRNAARVRAFLFSAAGNDIIGEEVGPDGQTAAVLTRILRPTTKPNPKPADVIDEGELSNRLTTLRNGYAGVIARIRSDARFATLPILVHGYSYPFAFPHGTADRRRPLWADQDQWLGRAFAHHGITDHTLRHAVLRVLLDRLHGMLSGLAKGPANQVWLVDCRDALPKVSDWADEIHGTSRGFTKVAARFRATLAQAGVSS